MWTPSPRRLLDIMERLPIYQDCKQYLAPGYTGCGFATKSLQCGFVSSFTWLQRTQRRLRKWIFQSAQSPFFSLKIHLMVCAVSLCNFLLFSSPVCCSKQCNSKIDLYLDYMDWRDPSKACSGLSGRLPSTGFSRHSS